MLPAELPDLFREREKLLLDSYRPTRELPDNAPRVGMPRALLFHELFPFWQALVTELGGQVVPPLAQRFEHLLIMRHGWGGLGLLAVGGAWWYHRRSKR